MKNSLSLQIPPPPAKLSAEAKRWWNEILESWDLQNASLLLLESGLECFDMMRQAQAILSEEGIVIEDRFGQKKGHPATLIERDSKANLLRHMKALGIDLEPLHDGPGRPAGGRNAN